MLAEHLIRLERRDAGADGQGLGRYPVLRRQHHHLVTVASVGVRLLGGVARRGADALGKSQIGVAGIVVVEHGIVRAAVPVRQHRGNHEFHWT